MLSLEKASASVFPGRAQAASKLAMNELKNTNTKAKTSKQGITSNR